MARKGSVRPRYYQIAGRRLRIDWDGAAWEVWDQDHQDLITHVAHAGQSRFVATAFPGKKWCSIKQAVEYTLMMRASS